MRCSSTQLKTEPPVPSDSWEGIRNATDIGHDCIALNLILQEVSGSEDCLYLNVYTKELPHNNNKKLKPVMFWIHGGGFTMGSGSPIVYGPDFLLTSDIVLVTINYRVGLLGFLNFEDPSLEIPGNMGLKDQVLALKWVRENISQFNGDPNNVTVFGESAGACSVHYLLLSPQTKGLFHKCIMQSGCIPAWWSKGHRSLPFIIKALRLEMTTSEKDILNTLQTMPAEDIIEMQNKIYDDFQPSCVRCYGPVVEYKNSNAFLLEEPEILLNSGKYHHVPIIIGYTSREGILAKAHSREIGKYGHAIQDFENKIPHSLKIQKGTDVSKVIANKIQKFYYGKEKPSELNKNQYYLLQGDVGFVWPTLTAVKKFKTTSKAPVYLYRMSADSNLNFFKKILEVNNPGASHADDLGYLFKNMLTVEIIPNSVEDKVMKTCVKLWTNFATHGNPNSSKKDDLININWKPVKGDDIDYLDIGENLTTGINPDQNRVRFWDELVFHKSLRLDFTSFFKSTESVILHWKEIPVKPEVTDNVKITLENCSRDIPNTPAREKNDISTLYDSTQKQLRKVLNIRKMFVIANHVFKLLVKNGKLRGKIDKDYDGGDYYSFQGIPYAKPPIGPLRFKDPLPSESWENVRDATESGNDCLASSLIFPDYVRPTASEDCLFLNVYTRALPDKNIALKPVMVSIHGGAFTMGSGSKITHGPDYLITKDVVVVTINYRIGILGFSSFDDPTLNVPGNAGMKDQVLALKWVQDNIANFNGDPNNVTIFGVSAGGASVHYLMLSPMTKGLFHKCIIQSGSALCPWAQGQKSSPFVAEALGMKTSTEREIFEALEKMSGNELIQLQDKIEDNLGCHFKRCWAPMVEHKSPSAFICENPQDIIRSGKYQQVPFMIGFTSKEGSIADVFFEEPKNGFVISNFENKIPFTFNIPKGGQISKLVATKIKHFYFGENEPCYEYRNQYYLLEGDTAFEWPIIKSVKEHTSASEIAVYIYRLSIESDFTSPILPEKKFVGVPHGSDIMYLYKSIMMPPLLRNTVDEKTMRKFVTMWTNFAISGNPNSPNNDALKKIQWHPVDSNDLHYLEIGENLTVGIDPDAERISHYDTIMPTAPIVTVKNGKLRGKIEKDYDGGDYFSFQGIPYAKPPIGPLRFKDPLPSEPWENVRDATESGNDCLATNLMFPEFQNPTASEDCLYLNVYTRALPDKNTTLKPVMVSIHGGAFTLLSGSKATHGPDYLITQDVVIVTINYRLGIFGKKLKFKFLKTVYVFKGFSHFDDPTLNVPGNAGMKDQVLALKWVQENITNFNGDPNNVTIFGVSAGGASVHYLMLSPLTKGLFHKCIIESGSAFCPWAQGHKSAPFVAEALGMKNATDREIFEALEKMSGRDLINVQDKIEDNLGSHFKRCWAPMVENKSPSAFISENPQNIIKSGKYQQVPFMIGFSSKEGSIADVYSEETKNGYVISNFENKIPFTFNIPIGSQVSKLVANKIKDFYYGDNEPCKEHSNQYYLLEGDNAFVWPIIKSVKEHIAVSKMPIYMYRVSIESDSSYSISPEKKFIGAPHGIDMKYLYKTIVMPQFALNTVDEKTMRKFVTMWTNFAISGNPNSPKNDALKKSNGIL
ncbi:hypothetical protein FQR65_LT09437 [Abscondita terminalis]|nr:hypothetical protein FQR65_LT09437 [Abscondita terminalis]